MTPKPIPDAFVLDSEEDVRILAASYFADLGFEPDELSTEDSFTIHLGHNDIVVGGKGDRQWVSARSDMLLTRQGRPFAVVEFKAPGIKLTNDDAKQAISYARLLTEIAPFAIVTNGSDTFIYDVISSVIEPLKAVADSTWIKCGQRITGIGEDLRYEAAHILIGLNAETLSAFCNSQLSRTLEDLKGSVAESKIYIPEVYIQRKEATTSIQDWLDSESSCFALIGDSGLGKTNTLCATAEDLASDNFVLFYRALRLPQGGLLDAIRKDFVWEFHRDRGPEYIIQRFDDLARSHNKKFIIMLDGLDEYAGRFELLKSELLDLAQRLRGLRVRLVVSCKSFNWSEFVIDNSQYYNTLAKSVYPLHDEVHHPHVQREPDAKKVGMWLKQFSDDEEDTAFLRYTNAYSLVGRLAGSLRNECQVPLMMRLVAETYSGRSEPLPSVITSRDLYQKFWIRSMGKLHTGRAEAERFLASLAQKSIDNDQIEIPVSTLATDLGTAERVDYLCTVLLQAGMLQVTKDEYGSQIIGFRFRKVAEYVYLVFSENWQKIPPEIVAQKMSKLLSSPSGAEVVNMYLTIIDVGRSDVLSYLAEQDFLVFTALIAQFELHSQIEENTPEAELQEVLLKRLENYVVGYSRIVRKYFNQIAKKIAPYGEGDIGLWIDGSSYQLRIRTPAYPQPIVVLPPNLSSSVFNNTLSEQLRNELQAGGPIHIGFNAITERIPDKVAWDQLNTQVGEQFVNRLLDESAAPALLMERAWEILIYDNVLQIEGMPPANKIIEILGFSAPEEVAMTSIANLLDRIREAVQRYVLLSGGMSNQLHQRWCWIQLTKLCKLFEALEQLSLSNDHLEMLNYTLDGLFSYLRTNDYQETTSILEALMPQILVSYKGLLVKNLQSLSNYPAFYNFAEASMLVEVSHSPAVARGDFLGIVYALLPSISLPGRVLVINGGKTTSFGDAEFVKKTLRGHSLSKVAWGSRFGRTKLQLDINGLKIDEPNATICVTRYPSHFPILDQVYQIAGRETTDVFGSNFHAWSNLDHGNITSEAQSNEITRRILSRLLS